jgi:hypothetical protein
MIWVGHVARIREMRNAYTVLVGEPEGKKQLARPRCRCQGNSITYLVVEGGGEIEPLGSAASNRPTVPAPDDR